MIRWYFVAIIATYTYTHSKRYGYEMNFPLNEFMPVEHRLFCVSQL